MANFFLIDQSLQRLGGHHYDYVRCVAAAANQQGFTTTIGTSRQFRGDMSLSNFGTVRRAFRHSTYNADSYLSGLKHLTRSKVDYLQDGPRKREYSIKASAKSFAQRCHLVRHNARRDRYISSFARDCHRFFNNETLTDSDHVFFATVNEIELMGLAAFLSNHPRTLQVNWHLQFHFNLFDGRTPEYQSQNKVARAVQGCFDAALARIPYHQVHFYTTSDTLADQFNRLKVGRFEALAYPIRPELFQKPESFNKPEVLEKAAGSGSTSPKTNREPLKITCPGEVRREKKAIEYLQPLVDNIWDRHLAGGNVQLVLQRPKKKLSRLRKIAKWAKFPVREKIELQPPQSKTIAEAANEDWVTYFEHPLSDADYLKLLNDADIGLLCYDSRAYFSRRAGVLGELLSCGKPVVVPAGSWLADQIQEPIFRHADRLTADFGTGRKIELSELSWSQENVPLAGGVVSFNQKSPFSFEFELEEGENAFAVEFDWHWPQERGVYCRLTKTELDGASESAVQVVGHRKGKKTVVCFFQTTGRKIQIELSNAFHESTANVRKLSIHPVAVSSDMNKPVPVGAVGVIAPDEQHIAAAVDEIVANFEHYQSTAAEYSARWCLRHEPKRTVSHLVLANQPLSKAG